MLSGCVRFTFYHLCLGIWMHELPWISKIDVNIHSRYNIKILWTQFNNMVFWMDTVTSTETMPVFSCDFNMLRSICSIEFNCYTRLFGTFSDNNHPIQQFINIVCDGIKYVAEIFGLRVSIIRIDSLFSICILI